MLYFDWVQKVMSNITTKYQPHKSLKFTFSFQGGVILVSHDERLIRMTCQELWVCSRDKVGDRGITSHVVACPRDHGFYSPEGSWLLSARGRGIMDFIHLPSFFQVFSLEGGFEEYRSIVEKELVL